MASCKTETTVSLCGSGFLFFIMNGAPTSGKNLARVLAIANLSISDNRPRINLRSVGANL